ncbi:MAG: penicillin acylase family protein, partial [Planctomycetota bacterium]|nr:penicillin acylase family protein [Planctomycetota bacterium]
EEALQIAASFNGPSQNVMIASSTGRIAWTLCGYLPNRVGFDGRWPVSWANAETGWAGALPESLRPSAIDPPGGMLYTANNRTVHLSVARRIGRNWASGTRAARIGELLRDQESMVERDHLAIQLDAQSQAHEIYRDTILTIITDDESDPRLRRAREVAAAWDGTANADQRAYALLRAYRSALVRAVVDPLVAPCRELEPNFIYGWTQSEESVLRILEEEPPHLLPSEFESWNQLRRAALIAAIDRLERRDLPIDARWGRVNATRIHHPIAQSVPLLGRWLNMPQRPQSGDWGVVRVAAPGAGASERLVVSPGREEDAIFHMPAGQSGHFLSDHFDAGHFDWLD